MAVDAPGPVSLHHTALVVADLDRAISFYTDHFGATIETTVHDVTDPHVAELHELPTIQFTLVFLRLGATRLELFRFAEPSDGQRVHGRSQDFGIRHICFEVDDVAAAHQRLAARGVRFTREPYTIPEGPARGTVLAFCRDPDGNRIELLQPAHE